MDSGNVTDGAVAGVVAAIVLGALAIGRDTLRSLMLRRAIMRSMQRLSIGTSLDGLTISIPNKMGRPLSVRSVAIQTMDGPNFSLHPTGEVRSISMKERKISRSDKRRLSRGEFVPGQAELGFGKIKQPVPSGFPVIEPFTSHTFLLSAEMIDALRSPVVAIRLVLEFTDHNKERVLLETSPKKNLDLANTMLELAREELESGLLDRQRAEFRRPPVQRLFRSQAPKSPSLEREV